MSNASGFVSYDLAWGMARLSAAVTHHRPDLLPEFLHSENAAEFLSIHLGVNDLDFEGPKDVANAAIRVIESTSTAEGDR